VSPQCHVVNDDHFETIRNDKVQTKSLWQELCGFEPIQKINSSDIKMQGATIPLSEHEVVNDQRIPLDDVAEEENDEENDDEAPVQRIDQKVPVQTTRSGRQVFLPSRYDDFVALEATVINNMEHEMTSCDPTALAASSDPDVTWIKP
jgi:hypothetical protein